MRPIIVMLAMLVASYGTQAGVSESRPESTATRKVLAYCDAPCEVRAQDQAFSLLMESYRQYRAFRIQATYEARISAASAIGTENGSMIISSDSQGMKALRGWVLHLADQERELSLQQLQSQVGNMQTTYSCARRTDEERAGQKIKSEVDPNLAAARLKDYQIIAFGVPNQGDFHTIEPIPAENILLDSGDAPVGNAPVITGCDE